MPFLGIMPSQYIWKDIRNSSMKLTADLAVRMFLKALVCYYIACLPLREHGRNFDLNTKDSCAFLEDIMC